MLPAKLSPCPLQVSPTRLLLRGERTFSFIIPFCPPIVSFMPSRRGLCLKAHAAVGGQIAHFPDSVRLLPSLAPQQELLQPAPAPGRADILVYYSILSAGRPL